MQKILAFFIIFPFAYGYAQNTPLEERDTLVHKVENLKAEVSAITIKVSDYDYLNYSLQDKKRIMNERISKLKKDKLSDDEKKLFRCFKWHKLWGGDVSSKCKVNLEKAPKTSQLILSYYDFYQLSDEEIFLRKKFKQELENKKSMLLDEMRPAENRLSFLNKKLEVEMLKREKIKKIIEKAKEKKLSCESDTHIDLEETTLKELPPTYQGSTNTCYAHALSAVLGSHLKNFVNPYDLAVHYKVKNTNGAFKLGWGNACQAFDAIKEIGVCVDSHEEMNASHTHQLSELLSGFYNDLYETKESEFDKLFLKNKSKSIIQSLRQDPNLKLPFPINTYAFTMNQMVVYASLEEEKEVLVEKEMWETYNEYRLKFYQDVLSQKSKEEIAEGFYIHHKKYFDTYPGIKAKKNEIIEKVMSNVTSYRSNSEKKAQIQSSLNFYFNQLELKSSERFACVDRSIDVLSSYAKLTNLSQETDSIIEKILANDQVSQADLYSSFLTPNCINKENRLPVNKLECEGVEFKEIGGTVLSKKQQETLFQTSVLEQLKKGNALLYSIPRHAMSIVGIRYNKEKAECEYKVRDSAVGGSSWRPESRVISESSFLGTLD